MGNPLFITFEGPEGGGKTTQIGALAERLSADGYNVLATRQPGGEPVGRKLRSILLDRDTPVLAPTTELLLMMADRAQSVASVIKPHLESGGIVLCDRYIDSSVAYQGYGRGLSLETIHGLNLLATGGLKPDVTFLLDLDPSVGLARQKETTKMELESLSFHQKVRHGFLEQARQNSERFIVIDASADSTSVLSRILEVVTKLL